MSQPRRKSSLMGALSRFKRTDSDEQLDREQSQHRFLPSVPPSQPRSPSRSTRSTSTHASMLYGTGKNRPSVQRELRREKQQRQGRKDMISASLAKLGVANATQSSASKTHASAGSPPSNPADSDTADPSVKSPGKSNRTGRYRITNPFKTNRNRDKTLAAYSQVNHSPESSEDENDFHGSTGTSQACRQASPPAQQPQHNPKSIWDDIGDGHDFGSAQSALRPPSLASIDNRDTSAVPPNHAATETPQAQGLPDNRADNRSDKNNATDLAERDRMQHRQTQEQSKPKSVRRKSNESNSSSVTSQRQRNARRTTSKGTSRRHLSATNSYSSKDSCTDTATPPPPPVGEQSPAASVSSRRLRRRDSQRSIAASANNDCEPRRPPSRNLSTSSQKSNATAASARSHRRKPPGRNASASSTGTMSSTASSVGSGGNLDGSVASTRSSRRANSSTSNRPRRRLSAQSSASATSSSSSKLKKQPSSRRVGTRKTSSKNRNAPAPKEAAMSLDNPVLEGEFIMHVLHHYPRDKCSTFVEHSETAWQYCQQQLKYHGYYNDLKPSKIAELQYVLEEKVALHLDMMQDEQPRRQPQRQKQTKSLSSFMSDQQATVDKKTSTAPGSPTGSAANNSITLQAAAQHRNNVTREGGNPLHNSNLSLNSSYNTFNTTHTIQPTTNNYSRFGVPSLQANGTPQHSRPVSVAEKLTNSSNDGSTLIGAVPEPSFNLSFTQTSSKILNPPSQRAFDANPQDEDSSSGGGGSFKSGRRAKKTSQRDKKYQEFLKDDRSISSDIDDDSAVNDNDTLIEVTDLNLLDPAGNLGTYKGTLDPDTGKPSGKGRIEYPGSGWYDGEWWDGAWNGQGTHCKSNGDVFEGTFLDHVKHGLGKYTYADGARIFTGRYVQGQRVEGSMKYQDGSTYQGQWYNGKRHGRGTYRFSDGSTYKGEFVKDRIHGAGQLVWPDGGRYVGEWSLGKRHGMGREFLADGTLRREGTWREGTPI